MVMLTVMRTVGGGLIIVENSLHIYIWRLLKSRFSAKIEILSISYGTRSVYYSGFFPLHTDQEPFELVTMLAIVSE